MAKIKLLPTQFLMQLLYDVEFIYLIYPIHEVEVINLMEQIVPKRQCKCLKTPGTFTVFLV